MEDEEDGEDVKKMIDILELSKNDITQDFQYDDFINCENSDNEEDEDSNFDDNFDLPNFTSIDISKLNSYDSRSTLKSEEGLVVESCRNIELKNLLLLNRRKNFQLMQLYKKLKDLLIQCQKDIKEKGEMITKYIEVSRDQTNSTGAWRLGAPYFKDKQLYPCPPNADTLRKGKNKELNVYHISIVKKWSSLECENLLGAVKVNYNINQQNDIMKKIKNIQQSKGENISELPELENRMKELQTNDNSEIPPLNSDQYIDWMRVSEVFLQDRRTFFECKSFWHIYLNPLINKSPWTPEENRKLKEIVKKHKHQNWDKIANEMGNNRTGFTVCFHYYRNLHEKFKKGDFTNSEDAMLRRLVHKHKLGSYIPWFKITQYFKNRTRSQLHHRYTYYLSQADKRRGKFSDAEDVLLMILVDRFGKNFKKCSEYLPTRSMVQLKARYNANLQQKQKKGSFTIQDDEIIWKYVEEQGEKSWAKLTKVLQRGRAQLRQRYNTIKSYLNKNPNSTLERVPRRKHNMSVEEDSFILLRMIADKFENSSNIPTLEEIEKVLFDKYEGNGMPKIIRNKFKSIDPDNIDDMLTNFFCNSFKMNASKCFYARHVESATKEVQSVLGVLKVNLDIPENFDEDLRLDNLDVAILNELKDHTFTKNIGISELIPPHLNSLVGLRSLLLINSIDNDNQEIMSVKTKSSLNLIKSDMARQIMNLPLSVRTEVEEDLNVFCKRFQSIFKWPAILTIHKPQPEQLPRGCLSEFTLNKKELKRTYSKVDGYGMVEQPEKRIKITELPSSSTKAVPLKLTPVTNKSIIQDLLRNKNKKLFSMETVKYGKETKMFIKEISIHPSKSNIETKSRVPPDNTSCFSTKREKTNLTSFVPQCGECIVLDEDDNTSSINNDVVDDSEDLKRLESFLKEHSDDISDKDDDDDTTDLKKLEELLREEND